MIQPEEDFQTWVLIASSTIDDPDQFAYFIPEIERLIDSIMETGSLPSPIENETDNFIIKLNSEIELKTLAITSLTQDLIQDYQGLYFKILDFGKYGVDIDKDIIVRCAFTIIKHIDASIYKISDDFNSTVITDYVFQIDLYGSVYNKIANVPPSLSLLVIYFVFVDELCIADDNFDLINFSTNIAHAALKIAEQNPRLNTKKISLIFSRILSSAINIQVNPYEFCEPWLELFIFFVKSEIFEKQLFALQQIQTLIYDPLLSNGALAFFSGDSLEEDGEEEQATSSPLIIFTEMKTIHPELCGTISEILTKLAEFGLVTDNLISHLWKLHSVQHSSDLSKFLVIFSSIATTLPAEQLPALVSKCIHPDQGCETEEWVKFLKVLAENIGSREIEDNSFSMVRDKLLEIALDNNSDRPTNLINAARNVLPSIIVIQMDQGAFDQISRQLITLLDLSLSNNESSNDSFDNLIFLFRLLSAALCTIQFEDKGEAEHLLKKSILFIQEKLPIIVHKNEAEEKKSNDDNSEDDENAFNREIVMNFISSLCYNNVLFLTNEELDILFHYRQTKLFSNIISRMVMKDLIPIDHLTSLIEKLTPEEIDDSMFNLVRDITYVQNKVSNNRPFINLPLVNEDLLWDLSLIDSQERSKFAVFLCQLYSRNDGIKITDYQMMSTFIQKWNGYFKQATKDKAKGANDNRKALIALLRFFISEIESQQDLESLNVHRHSTGCSQRLIHVEITGKILPSDQVYELPDTMLLFVLRQRIAKLTMLPPSSIVFSRFAKKIPNTMSLKQLAGNSEKIGLNVTSIQNMKPEAFRDTRDILPSQLIIQNYPETFNMLMSLLKEKSDTVNINNIDSLLYNFSRSSIDYEAKLLLNYLPTNSGTLMQIQEMKKFQTFDYESFFPLEYQNLFMYNFESFQEVFNEEEKINQSNKIEKLQQEIFGIESKQQQEQQEQIKSNNLRVHFNRTGGFLYLIKVIPKIQNIQLSRRIFLFLEKVSDSQIISNYGQTIFDTLYPYVAEISNDTEQLIQFTILSTFLKAVFKPNNDKQKLDLKLTEDFLDKVMKPLMLSPIERVRFTAPDLFLNIPIPISLFIDLSESLEDETAATFYNTLYPHVNLETIEKIQNSEDMEILIKLIRLEVAKQPSYLATVLAILDNLLDISNNNENLKIIEEKDKIAITECLVNRYLNPDPRDKEKAVFTYTVRCLSKMQNDFLLSHLENLHHGRNMYSDWDIDGDSNIISPNGHCGLVNLGATCFLNSTLQQFFAIPILRNAIIGYKGNNDFLNQLKILFAEMYLSKGQLINPSKLIDVWTGWDGEPMNPMVQQDALEFAQMLIDKLEGGLSPAFLNQIFGGTTIDKFIGLSEEYESQQKQPFTSFTLPIQGSSNVFEALLKLQDPDFLTGANQYYAESLKKKIDAKKVAMFGKLPQILILQLSRFEYNYQEGYRTKINSVFTFPSQLDLAPYTDPSQGQENNDKKQETVYELRGVVMHHGTADFGHYTSYIKDIDTNKWFLYNDSFVSEVKEEEVLINGSGKEGKGSSGYILFYDRIDTLPISRKINSMQPQISNRLVREISLENKMKDEYRLFCSEPYFEFMTLLATTRIKSGFNPRFVAIAIQYYFDTFPFTLHVKRANELVPPICEKLKESDELRRYFIQYLNEGPFSCSLIYCPTIQVRQGVIEMIKSVDIDLIEFNFIERIIESIPTVTPYYIVFDQCFLLLDYFLTNSNKLFSIATRSNLLVNCLQLLVNNISKHINENNLNEDDFYMSCNLSGVFQVISRFYFFIHNKPIQPFKKENVGQISGQLTQQDLNNMNIFIGFVLNDDYLRNVLNSKTSVSSLTLLLKSFDDCQEKVQQHLINFAEKNGIYVPFLTITNLLFNYFKMDAVPLINRCHFMIDNRSSNMFDLALSIYFMIKYDSTNKSTFLKNSNNWLFKFITDDLYECRIATEHVISLLVPDLVFLGSYERKHQRKEEEIKEIKEVPSLPEMPMNEIITSAEQIEFIPKEKRDQEMINDSRLLLDVLLMKKDEFISLITSTKNASLSGQSSQTLTNYNNGNSNEFGDNVNIGHAQSLIQVQAKLYSRSFIGCQYIDLIDRLSIICGYDISNDLINIATAIINAKQNVNQTQIFDAHLARICVALKRSLNIYKKKENFDYNSFFLNFFPRPELEAPLKAMRSSMNPNISNASYSISVSLNFFNAMEGVIEEDKYPQSFITSFMLYYAYNEAALTNHSYTVVCSYLRAFVKSDPQLVFSILKENLKRLAVICYSGVIVTLDYLNKGNSNDSVVIYKLPLLNFLWYSVNKHELFTLNEIVVKTFAFDSTLQNENENDLSNVIDYNKLLSIISLLNSPALLSDGRKCVWDLVFAQRDTIPFTAFNYIYKWKGDWPQVAKFIVCKFEGKNKANINEPDDDSDDNNFVVLSGAVDSAVELSIEASMNSLEAFSILLDFLLEFSPETVLNKADFAQSIISQEIDEKSSQIIIRFIKLFLSNDQNLNDQNLNVKELVRIESVSESDFVDEKLLRPIANVFIMRAKFLIDILNDVISNEGGGDEVDGNDLVRLFGLLIVLNEFDHGKAMVKEQVDMLKVLLNNEKINAVIKIDELNQLKKLLDSF